VLEAFRFVAPRHGGSVLSFDRRIAILFGMNSVRDVIAFPQTAMGAGSMSESPGAGEPRHLRGVYLELRLAKNG
jgi:aspartyl-tRNA synthetase